MTNRIFIGWDSRFPEPALVLAHTIRKNARRRLDIRFLDYRHLQDCYGFNRTPDPTASTEFSFSRFLVPYLCGYEGWALFLDNDCLCFGDIAPLLDSERPQCAVQVVKHPDYQPASATKFGDSGTPQAVYPRKNWSSVMLMNCRELQAWTPEVVATAPGARLHRFEDIEDAKIGSLFPGWNRLTHFTLPCGILHYTDGGPWFKGCEDVPHADLWLAARKEWLQSIGDPDRPLVPITL